MNFIKLLFGGSSNRPGTLNGSKNTVKDLTALKFTKTRGDSFARHFNKDVDSWISSINKYEAGKPSALFMFSPKSTFESAITQLRDLRKTNEGWLKDAKTDTNIPKSRRTELIADYQSSIKDIDHKIGVYNKAISVLDKYLSNVKKKK